MITVEQAREYFRYEPDTGDVFWAVDKGRVKAGTKTGRPNARGYLCTKVCQRTVSIHRLAWLIVHGRWPRGDIDHINRNRLDNRLANLRECTRAQNFANRGGKVGRMLPKGVRLSPSGKRFVARITDNGREISLGGYSTAEEAQSAYQRASAEIYGEFGSVVHASRER